MAAYELRALNWAEIEARNSEQESDEDFRRRMQRALGTEPVPPPQPPHTPQVHPTQYRRAPNGRGYRVLDVYREDVLMRQDDGLRVIASVDAVDAWELESGPATMTVSERNVAHRRLMLSHGVDVRAVTGGVEWANRHDVDGCARLRCAAWEGAVRLAAKGGV